jgi:transcriptional regulator PpsR
VTRRVHEPADLSALSECASELAEAIVSLSSDIALVIDDRGVITQVAQNERQPMLPLASRWVGRPWAETVTDDTRRKVELMLSDVHVSGVARRREVNVTGDAGDIPLAYTALRLGSAGPVIAVGRDLRAMAAIQQRFLDVQQEMERSYWRARQLESRYRLLFQVATDAVMTVEAQSLRIVEANHAAVALFGHPGRPLAGQVAAQQFDTVSRPAVQGLLDNARSHGRPAEIPARLAGSGAAVAVSATPFRARDGMRLLLRVRGDEPASDAGAGLNLALARLVDTTHDGVVVTDSAGRILVANPAFIRMAGAENEDRVRARPIADWVGRIADDVPALIAGVHGHGIAQLVRTELRRGSGLPAIDVDVTAALLTEGDQECFGFTLRACAAPAATPGTGLGPRLAAALTALEAGIDDATPTPGLLERAQRLVQEHLARHALERFAGDAARAAASLGLSPAEFARLREATAGASGD